MKIHFNDGTQGMYDISSLAGKGVFKIWDTDDSFSKAYISKKSGAISWPGEIDIDTRNAYCSIKGVSPDKYFHDQMNHATY